MSNSTIQAPEAFDAAQARNNIASSARETCNTDTRIVDDLEFGDIVQQGDLYLERLPLDFDLSEYEARPDMRQLVIVDDPSESSVGSRHILRDHPHAVCWVRKENRGPTEGPVVVAPEGLYVEHPKHAHDDIRQPGCYRCTYQLDKTAERLGEIRRRRD